MNRNDFMVIIDCGHGESTPGKRSPWSANKVEPALPFFEWEWSRKAGKLVADKLQAAGVNTAFTVNPSDPSDLKLTLRYKLANRIKQANPNKKCIFLSIHVNAAGNGAKWMTGTGWSAYTTKGQNRSDVYADKLYDAAEEILKPVGVRIRTDKSDGDRDIEANFTVIYGAAMPAVLVENMFQDNISDVEFLTSPDGIEMLTDVMVKGSIDFLESEYGEKQ